MAVSDKENAPVKAEDSKEKLKSAKDKKSKKDALSEMTEEDKKLQDDLNLLVERLSEPNEQLYPPALEMMKTLIRASTTSMTSVPKPLKFMRPHYRRMKEIQEKMSPGPWKKSCADIISVLSMTSDETNDCINYRLKGMAEPISDWGHEYVRHLTMGLAAEWRFADAPRREELLKLVKDIVGYHMKHNAEVEACDLLLEIEQLDMLLNYVEEVDHSRVCMYLLSSAPLTPDPDNMIIIRTAKDIYLKFERRLEAMRCAIMLNSPEVIKSIFSECKDPLMKNQMAILLGRHQSFFDLPGASKEDTDLNSNMSLTKHFHSLAKELDIMEPKTPEGIYKSHLEQTRPFSSALTESNRLNIAASFVNGFVNCGFGVDKILQDTETANKFFYKNREFGIMSSVASLGLIYRWDIDNGLAQVDRFLYANDDYIRAGSLLAVGIISSGVQDPCDPASALLMDHVHSDRPCMRIGSIFGLGLAYANSKREAVIKEEDGGVIFELKKVLADQKPSATSEVKGLAGMSLGFILVGTADHKVAMEMLHLLMDKTEAELTDYNWSFVALGIALIFLGTQEKSEVFVESLRSLPDPFGSMVSTLVDVCAYAGTGNVLKIQRLLHICSEHYESDPDASEKRKSAKDNSSKASADPKKPKTSTETQPKAATSPAKSPIKEAPKPKDPKAKEKVDLSPQQAVAVLGIGLIAMGEDIGSQMAIRMFGHLIRYGEPPIRRAVPLALALLSVSNPQLNLLETLSKFTHDADVDTARNAVFALGIVGAGTNNARLVTMLRQLSTFHYKDPVSLMLVRIAQGLAHLGKGTMTLNPFHSDRQLMCQTAVAAIFATCFSFLDAPTCVLNNHQHYLLYSLVLAVQPRHLVTLIEDELHKGTLKSVNVSVRVGQAVDVVAQAGKPKTITGFQTHTTPVLLAHGERAELATDEYISLTPYLEGLVILKKAPTSAK
uniref:26S proteasome non-ATPase regulatory subunit 2 n=1 Tax=Panagrellus redivivus TaxID=6233 RepID=A0A7E4VA39_PANRE